MLQGGGDMLKYDFVFYREGGGGLQTHTSVEEHSSMELVVFCQSITSTDRFLLCQRVSSHRLWLIFVDRVWNKSHKIVLYCTICVKYCTSSLTVNNAVSRRTLSVIAFNSPWENATYAGGYSLRHVLLL